ncbi:MAG: TonB family protein [Caulobacteraceae bacterium]|nr:MAG: TonB family protein [Caulobacteraceae bacterium]
MVVKPARLIAALGLSFLAAPASAWGGQDAGPPPPPATKPLPTAPATPDDPNEGRVVLNCAVQPDGNVRDCRIVEEAPAGFGFGQAAIRVAAQSRLSPEAARTIGPDGRVQWTTRFRLDD